MREGREINRLPMKLTGALMQRRATVATRMATRHYSPAVRILKARCSTIGERNKTVCVRQRERGRGGHKEQSTLMYLGIERRTIRNSALQNTLGVHLHGRFLVLEEGIKF